MRYLLPALAFAVCAGAQAQDAVLGEERARTLPIADVHFHMMPFMDPAVLLQYMDRHGVRWTGGARPVPFTAARTFLLFRPYEDRWKDVGRDAGNAMDNDTAAVLGKRYFRATGQGFWAGLNREGVAIMDQLDHPAVRRMLELVEENLRAGWAVVGELHVNNSSSAASPQYAYKSRADSPVLRALFALATKYRRPMNIHAQWDRDTVEEIDRLIESTPGGRLILSHCGVWATAGEIRQFFQRHRNAWCDLSFRSPPHLRGRMLSSSVYGPDGIRREWKLLIEEFSDRFMVGIDDVHSWEMYDETVHAIRAGLLAHLTPAAAEKVAWRNAQALFGLE